MKINRYRQPWTQAATSQKHSVSMKKIGFICETIDCMARYRDLQSVVPKEESMCDYTEVKTYNKRLVEQSIFRYIGCVYSLENQINQFTNQPT